MAVVKVHHINCGTMLPLGHQIPGFLPRSMVAHVMVVESADRLILVDSGFGLADVREKSKRLGPMLPLVARPILDESECAIRQLPRLGYDASDVTDIVLTHLDLDHAGGLSDFPQARVHLSSAELSAATHPKISEKARYVSAQWAHRPTWVTHDLDTATETWNGFASVRAITDDVLLIGLAGHTRGHTGVAIGTDTGWLLHAGDAYMSAGDTARPRQCPPGLRAFQRVLAANNQLRIANLGRLADLRASGTARIFSAHSMTEFDSVR